MTFSSGRDDNDNQGEIFVNVVRIAVVALILGLVAPASLARINFGTAVTREPEHVFDQGPEKAAKILGLTD